MRHAPNFYRAISKRAISKRALIEHAQVKLTEMWKALNYNNYPLNIEQLQPAENGRSTRGISRGRLAEPATLNTFIGNATRLWNKAPIVIRDSKSISAAKAAIKLFCKTLPV